MSEPQWTDLDVLIAVALIVCKMRHNGCVANESSHVDAECWKCRLTAALERGVSHDDVEQRDLER